MKTKPNKRKELIKELDKLWGQIVHKMWGEKCAWPGCVHIDHLAAHHFYHKSHGLRARWNVDNGILLDFFHHIHEVHQRGNTEPIRDKLIEVIGQKRFDLLKENVAKTWKPSISELEDLKRQFEGML